MVDALSLILPTRYRSGREFVGWAKRSVPNNNAFVGHVAIAPLPNLRLGFFENYDSYGFNRFYRTQPLL